MPEEQSDIEFRAARGSMSDPAGAPRGSNLVLRRLVPVGLLLLAAALRLWRLPTLPPGLYIDEAVNGIDIRMLLSGNGLPLYFANNNGREPLFLYLQALAVAALGVTPLALRLVAAGAGIFTVAAVYYCARVLLRPPDGELGASDDLYDVIWPAAIAAGGVAVSYWALSLSRLGLRAVLLPPVSALAIAFFWRAWHGRRYRDYVWAGLWFAASLYTYVAARLLLLVPMLFVLSELLVDLRRARWSRVQSVAVWPLWRARLLGGLVPVAAAVLLTLPLAVVAWREPGLLLARPSQVSILTNGPEPSGQMETPAGLLLSNVVHTVRNFYDQGDLHTRHNLPGRPANDPLQAVLFTVGWLAALRYLRQPRARLILIWFLVMLLPTVLSAGAPHNLRAAGALPALAMLYALGAQALLTQLRSRASIQRWAAPACLAAFVLIGGVLTGFDYFERWAQLPQLGAEFTAEGQMAAGELTAMMAGSDPASPVLLSHRLYAQPQMVYAIGLPQPADSAALAEALRRPGLRILLERSFDPRQSLELVWQADSRWYAADLQPLDADGGRTLAQALAGDQVRVINGREPTGGGPQLVAGSLPPGLRLQARRISNPLDVRFERGVRLLGYDLRPDPSESPGAARQYRLTLFWQADDPSLRDPSAPRSFVNLANSSGVWLSDHVGLPEGYLWPYSMGSHVIEDVHRLAAPAEMQPGKAWFEVGLEAPDQSGPNQFGRLGILDGQGRTVADQIRLGPVMVNEPAPQADLSGLRPIAARFGDRIDLAGWQVRADPAQPNAALIDLAWRAFDRPTSDYTAFVHLIDSTGQIVAQQDLPPGGTHNPTTQWVPGETVRSTFVLSLPAGRLAGLRLRVGLYEPVSGRQLPVSLSSPTNLEAHETYLVMPLPGT